MTERRAKQRRIKLGLTCTPGGHYEQMLNLAELYRRYPHFWITASSPQALHSAEDDKKYFIVLAHFKRPWQYLTHLPEVLRAFLAERPTHILSTGSGRIVFIPYLISRMARVKFIHIETFSHVHSLTKMGRILSALGHPVYSQWDSSRKKAIYIGPILGGAPVEPRASMAPPQVFVTTGTRTEPFPRLLLAVEALIREGVIRERVVVQAGHTRFRSELMEIFDFCPPAEIDALIRGSRYVITQESAGIATKCLKAAVKFLVMPRSYANRELPAMSDMNEDLHIRLAEMGFTEVVHDVPGMRAAVERIDGLKTGFPFDNSRALRALRAIIEEGT